jgi:TIR domain
MADVFISYAKADRTLALKLAAMLEAEGWKTWWDTSLIPGDDFRNEIMTELGRARHASIKSDWVRSEAGRAGPCRSDPPPRTAFATRWRFCGLPQSASCSENFVIPPDVFGQTLSAQLR